MSTLKALALGSYSEVKYHPFAGVDREIEQILANDLQVFLQRIMHFSIKKRCLTTSW